MVNISKIAGAVCKTAEQVTSKKTLASNCKTLSETLAGTKPKLNPELMFKEIKMPKEKSFIGSMVDKALYGFRKLFRKPKPQLTSIETKTMLSDKIIDVAALKGERQTLIKKLDSMKVDYKDLKLIGKEQDIKNIDPAVLARFSKIVSVK